MRERGPDDGWSFAELLRTFRERAGQTQYALARRAGISEQAVSLLERGVRRRPRRDTVERLGRALGLSSSEAERLLAESRGTRRSDAPRPAEFRWYDSDIRGLEQELTRVFVGQEPLLDELTRFAWSGEGGCWLVEAPPGYGKSAIVLQLRRRLRAVAETGPGPMLACAFLREQGRHNTARSFLDTACSQLAHELSRRDIRFADVEEQRRLFLELWELACERASADRPLLLVVDGLDEADTSVHPTAIDVLPDHELPPFVHLLVTSRPNPQARQQVESWHPLARAHHVPVPPLDVDDVRALLLSLGMGSEQAAAVAHHVHQITRGEPMLTRFVAEDVARDGQAALDDLARNPPMDAYEYIADQVRLIWERAGSQPGHREVIAALLAARGPIHLDDLAEALRLDPTPVVTSIKRFLAGRERYQFAHALYRDVLCGGGRLDGTRPERYVRPADLEASEEALRELCGRYVEAGMPPGTPDYVVEHAGEHLSDDPRLFGLVSEQWRDLTIERRQSLAPFAADVARAAALAASLEPCDVVERFACALVLAKTADFACGLPTEVRRAMVRLGQTERAAGYARLNPDPEDRCQHLLDIARHTGRREFAEEALSAARSIEDEGKRSEHLTRVTNVLNGVPGTEQTPEDGAPAGAGGLAAARSIADRRARSIALGRLAVALQRPELLDEAVAAARRGPEDPMADLHVIGEEAATLARAGGVDEALALARSFPPGDWASRGQALTGIATVLAAGGRVEEALRIIGSPLVPDWVLHVFAAGRGHLDAELTARIWQRLQDVSRWA